MINGRREATSKENVIKSGRKMQIQQRLRWKVDIIRITLHTMLGVIYGGMRIIWHMVVISIRSGFASASFKIGPATTCRQSYRVRDYNYLQVSFLSLIPI